MPRFFNTAGPCLAEDHYMLPPERRLREVRPLIEAKAFFVIHAPRQTGKTTLLRALARELTAEGRYAALAASVESFTEPDADRMLPRLVSSLREAARYQLPEPLRAPPAEAVQADPSLGLKHLLTAWSAQIDRPLVLLLDEVDSLPGPVLISVLRQLRDGYCSRPAPFPQTVVLVGMRDVRDYRADVRPDQATLGTSSPFNVKSDSLTLPSFTEAEVTELLGQHTAETGQVFTDEAVATIFDQGQGQPWLTNALAAQLVTRHDALVPDRSKAVTREPVLQAREILIARRDTHLDSLVARLHEDRVRRVIEPILIGDLVTDATYDDDFRYVKDLGLVSVSGGTRRIANPIYQEIIPRVLTHQTQTSIAVEPAWFLAADGTLDLDKLIAGFLEFWQENGEVLLRGMPYHEAAPHLTFMAYLQRVVNSGGRIEREFAIGTGRADLVVELGGRRDVIELKLARAPKALPRGLDQVARYARKLGRDRGYLVIFDPRATTPWEDRGSVEEVLHEGVTVVVLRA
jgi:type II secretory pathway predicted ATPase ExeA